jgi:hypothetical protein
MRKTLFLFFCIVLLFQGCVTFKPEMLTVEKNPISTRLNKLDIITPSTASGNVRSIKSQTYYFTIFQRELETNIINQEQDDSFGTIEMIHIVNDIKYYDGWFYVSIFTGCVLNLLGMPVSNMRVYNEFDFCIYDSNKKLVKKYNYSCKKKSLYGWYYGKTAEVLEIETVKDVLSQFKTDLSRDVDYLNRSLMSAYDKKK